MESREVFLFVTGDLAGIVFLLEFVEFVFVVVDLVLLGVEGLESVCHSADVELAGGVEAGDLV